MSKTFAPRDALRLSSIVQDEMLQAMVGYFQERTGVKVWFRDSDGYTVGPETQVPVYCSLLLNHGHCPLANPAIPMPARSDLMGFRSCIAGIGHVVLPIRHRAPGGQLREIGRLVSEPIALEGVTISDFLPTSRELNIHPDNLGRAAQQIPRVAASELAELTRLLAIALKRVAEDRTSHAHSLAVAEAFDSVGAHANREVIYDLLAALVRDFSDADAVVLSTVADGEDPPQHVASCHQSLPEEERGLLMTLTAEVVRWISQAASPISFPDLGGSDWAKHVLGGREFEGALVAVPVKSVGDWRGWWTAYYRQPMAQMEDQLHRLSVLAAHSAQTLKFVAQLEASQEAAMTDALTGVGNRRFLHEQLSRELSRSNRARSPLTMLIVDVDNFKQVNDNHGHSAGDAALRLVAEALSAPLRRSSTVSRYGGDEFCVVIPDCSAPEAAGVAARLQQEVEARALAIPGAPDLRIRVSIGVATLDPTAAPTVDLFELADEALIRAKREGKNRVMVSSE